MQDDPSEFIAEAINTGGMYLFIRDMDANAGCGPRRDPATFDMGQFVRNYGPGQFRIERRTLDSNAPKGAIIWTVTQQAAREFGWIDPDSAPPPEILAQPARPSPAAPPPTPWPQHYPPPPPAMGQPGPGQYPPQYPPPWWGWGPPQQQQPPAGDAMLAAAVTMMTKTLEQSANMAKAHTEAPKTPASESLALLRELRGMLREEERGDDDDKAGADPEVQLIKPLAEALADMIRGRRKRADDDDDKPAAPAQAKTDQADPHTLEYRLGLMGDYLKVCAASNLAPSAAAASCLAILGPQRHVLEAQIDAPDFTDQVSAHLPEVPRAYIDRLADALRAAFSVQQPAPPAPGAHAAASVNGTAR